jgi:hypothetical protein
MTQYYTQYHMVFCRHYNNESMESTGATHVISTLHIIFPIQNCGPFQLQPLLHTPPPVWSIDIEVWILPGESCTP